MDTVLNVYMDSIPYFLLFCENMKIVVDKGEHCATIYLLTEQMLTAKERKMTDLETILFNKLQSALVYAIKASNGDNVENCVLPFSMFLERTEKFMEELRN